MSDIPSWGTATAAPSPDPFDPEAAPVDPETAARHAGWSWGDIGSYIADATSTALGLGYTPGEVDKHLGRPDPKGQEDHAQATWSGAFAEDPSVLNMVMPGGNLDLTANPNFRSDYAAALLNGEVRGPQDFADGQAAAALSAAHDLHGVDDTNMQDVREKQAQAGLAAGTAADDLPTKEDLTDAALSLSDNLEDQDQVRANLMDRWLGTGQNPANTAMQADADPALRSEMLAARPLGAVDATWNALAKAAGFVGSRVAGGAAMSVQDAKDIGLGAARGVTGSVIGLEHIGEAAFSAIADMTGSEGLHGYVVEQAAVWKAREDRWNAALAGTDWSQAGANPIGFAAGVFGEAVPTIAEYVALGIPAMIVYGAMHGADYAYRETGSWAAAAAGALIGGGSAGAPAPFLKGAAGKSLIENAVRGAVGMGIVGGIQSVADPVPRSIATGEWNAPSWEGIEEGVVKGAIGGALFGTYGGVKQMRAKVIDSSKPPGEAVTETTAQEALKEVTPASMEPAGEDQGMPAKEIFKEGSTPAEKLARLSQLELENTGHLPNIMESGTFFQRRLAEMGETDPATIELAKGYETAAGVLHFIKSLMGDVLTNTEGSVPRQPVYVAPPTPEPTPHEETVRAREASALGGPVEPLPPNTTRAFPPDTTPYKAPKPQPPTPAELEQFAAEKGDLKGPRGKQDIGRNYQQEPARPPPENTSSNREAVRDVLREKGGLGEQLIIHFGQMIDSTRALLNPHLPEWMDANKSGVGMMDTVIGHAVRAFEGKTFYFDENGKRQVVRFAPDDPLKPVFDVYGHINEAVHDLVTQRVTEGKLEAVGYIKDYWAHLWEDPNAALEAYLGSGGGQGRAAGFKERSIPTIEDGLNMGLKLKIVDPGDLMLYDVSTKIKYLHHLDAMDRLENMGLLVYGEGTRLPFRDAVKITGRSAQKGDQFAYLPAAAAKLYNNAISQGWYAFPQTGTTFQKLMWLKNTSVATKMIVPLFHSFVIAEQTLATGAQIVMSELRAGNFGQAAIETAKTLSLVKAKEIAQAGAKAMSDYANMTGDADVQMLVESGARFGKRQLPYQTGAVGYHTLIAQNKGHVVEAALREITREAKSTLGEEGENILTRGAMFVPRVAGVGLAEISRATTMTSAPLFDYAIPAMKAGSALLRAQQFTRLHPDASPEAVKTRMRQIVDNIDDRFGEMNQDNLFWNKWTKQTANMATISTSWAYGTWRWLAAGSGYNIERGVEWNPEATSSLIGAVAVYAGANALMTFINTHERPKDVWDLVNFRTGGTTKTGAAQRGLLPTEFKELFDMGKIVANAMVDPMSIPKGLGNYVAGKENPVFQIFTALLTGEDAVGHKISQTPRGWTGYFEDQVKPIIFNNISGDPPGTGLNKFERTFIREAPAWVEDPQAYHDQQIKLTDRWTKEELARARREAIAAGQEPPPKPAATPRHGGWGRATASRNANARYLGSSGPSWGSATVGR